VQWRCKEGVDRMGRWGMGLGWDEDEDEVHLLYRNSNFAFAI